MTDAEKISTTVTAALYQQQLDALTRTREGYKAQLATVEAAIAAKTKSLDDLWKSFRVQVGSGS